MRFCMSADEKKYEKKLLCAFLILTCIHNMCASCAYTTCRAADKKGFHLWHFLSLLQASLISSHWDRKQQQHILKQTVVVDMSKIVAGTNIWR